jgi:hypothetical protein
MSNQFYDMVLEDLKTTLGPKLDGKGPILEQKVYLMLAALAYVTSSIIITTGEESILDYYINIMRKLINRGELAPSEEHLKEEARPVPDRVVLH